MKVALSQGGKFAWLPSEDEQLRLMTASGHTIEDVSAALKRSESTVLSRASKLGLRKKLRLNSQEQK